VALIEAEPELPVQPDGKVQVYDVAPFTGEMLKVLIVPWQTEGFPLIAPGWDGMD
jgi:hypothetical protein